MIALIALAGGLGAVLRFVVDGAVARWVRSSVPLGTFVVNLSGSFVLGLVVASTATGSDVRAVVGTGLLGGYTTFSAASVESVLLARAGGARAVTVAALHAAAMLAAGLAAAALGLWAG
ncbi:fluoride efflux transporter FluC [Aeromicrobium choanae]|uniref:Fluoride-specific ion channel FluC n=1 Tax=Aeromicrobium choanae TaxID=1736691 RepID=A0A1T4YV34_9ACTN|nr:CrcB family protein [Aeromicrobium choanae]SKB05095.1 camphor resistance protein CrcB [Aeromicrobium choanae]